MQPVTFKLFQVVCYLHEIFALNLLYNQSFLFPSIVWQICHGLRTSRLEGYQHSEIFFLFPLESKLFSRKNKKNIRLSFAHRMVSFRDLYR